MRASVWPIIDYRESKSIMLQSLWMCMKQSYFISTLLIPDLKGLGNKHDIYLQHFYRGIERIVGSWGKNFLCILESCGQLTIFMFMQICLDGILKVNMFFYVEIASQWLCYIRKLCYRCHRCWLKSNLIRRYNKRNFDGILKFKVPPSHLMEP